MKKRTRRTVRHEDYAARPPTASQSIVDALGDPDAHAMLLDALDDAVLALDCSGRIAYWNRYAETLFGWRQEEVLGKDFICTLIAEDRQASLADAIPRVQAGSRWAEDIPARRKEGPPFPAHLSLGPLQDTTGGVAGIVGVVHDVSDKRRGEEALLEAARRRDEFLASLSHELRNPLAAIRSAVDAMQLSGHLPPDVAWVGPLLDSQTEHLTRLVNDVLDISRVVQGRIPLHIMPLDMRSPVTHAAQSIGQAMASKRQVFTLSIPEQPVWVDGDAVRLSQAVGNLLDNASRYTQEEGRIALTVEVLDGRLAIRVEDNGQGIPAALLPYIFDIFSGTAASAPGGMALGLALARRIVEMHNGSIAASSPGAGQGSSFLITLPQRSPPPQQAMARSETADRLRAAPILRVLVLDDDEMVVLSTSAVLELLGYKIQVARNGQEAIAAGREFLPHAVLLDISMPDMNGYEVARRLRAQPETKDAVLIALTGHGFEEYRTRAAQAGFNHFLVKPVSRDALAELLASIQSQTLGQSQTLDHGAEPGAP